MGGGNLILQDVTNDEFVFTFEPKSKNALKFYKDGSIRFSNGEMWLNSTGDLEMSWDNNKIYFGTGDDASITYDGTDMQINPAEVGSGSLEIGDGTNYTEIKSDGEINLHGTARVKKEFDISITKLSPGGSGATTAQIGNYAGESFDINDDVVGSFEVPHDCDTSENLEFRVYWAIDEAYATNSGEVQWELDWSATSADETEALDSPTHTGTIDFGDQDIPATAKYLTRTSAGVLSSASLSDDDLVGFTVKRIALDGGSNPTADPIAFRVEVEYTSNKLGEAL